MYMYISAKDFPPSTFFCYMYTVYVTCIIIHVRVCTRVASPLCMILSLWMVYILNSLKSPAGQKVNGKDQSRPL